MSMSKAVDEDIYCRRTRLKLDDDDDELEGQYYLPYELWRKIIFKVPLKSLVMCKSVSKQWNAIASRVLKKANGFKTCGVLFNDPSTSKICYYYSYKTNKGFMLNDQQFIVPSDKYRGILADLSFDFSGVVNGAVGSFVTTDSRGLFLVVHDDFSYHVHNPATKQVFTLPKSSAPTDEKTGFIVNWTWKRSHVCGVCRFWVIRICRARGLIEWCCFPDSKGWQVRKITMPSVLKNAHWSYDNYVVHLDTRTLYLLTDQKFGVVLNLNQLTSCPQDYVVDCDILLLPGRVRHHNYCKNNARLGERLGEVNLSYYTNEDGGIVRLWQLDQNSSLWRPLLKINKGQVCKSLGQKRLVEFLEAGDTVIPWAHYGTPGYVLLTIKSCIYVYGLFKHSLIKLFELGEDYKLTSPFAKYLPCLASLKL